MEVAAMSANQWLQAISEKLHHSVDEVDKDFYSVKQLCGIWNLSNAQTSKRVFALREKGMLIEKKFRITTGNKTYPVSHFKIK
jgi:hypothetical protein